MLLPGILPHAELVDKLGQLVLPLRNNLSEAAAVPKDWKRQWTTCQLVAKETNGESPRAGRWAFSPLPKWGELNGPDSGVTQPYQGIHLI